MTHVCLSEDALKKNKRPAMDWEKIFAKHRAPKGVCMQNI